MVEFIKLAKNLVKQGFDGHIICTYATRDLATIMLRDSAKIQHYDIEFH